MAEASIPADPDPNCKRCKGTGEEPNAQFRCPCRWRFTQIPASVTDLYDAIDANKPAEARKELEDGWEPEETSK